MNAKKITEHNELIATRVPPVIKTVEEEIIPEPPKGFNIYGDPI